MRKTAKLFLEYLLSAGPATASRRLRGGRGIILAYHNIVPHGSRAAGDSSLHLPQESFAAQLTIIEDLCDVVSLPSLLDATSSGGSRPRVAITFDDAYQGAVSVGIAELRQKNFPATFFVAPGLLEGKSFWWDALVPGGAAELSPQVRSHALTGLRGQDDAIRSWASVAGIPQAESEPHATGASSHELQQAMTHEGLTLAAHSWSHPNLTMIDDRLLAHELKAPLEWLNARFPRVLPYLAYPYGLGDSRVAAMAQAVGYTRGLRVAGGWIPKGNNGWELPRMNVPGGLSGRGLSLRLSGLLS